MLPVKLVQVQIAKKLFSGNYLLIRNGLRLYSAGQNLTREYTKKDRESFERTFPEFQKSFIETIKKYDNTILSDWMEKCVDYNLPHGPLSRGQLVVLAYKLLAHDSQLDHQNIKIAQNIGWCAEMHEAGVIISDDLIDQTDTRRGKRAWHKVDTVGEQTWNDAIIFIYGSFMCLENLVGHKKYYCELAKRFRDGTLSIHLAQSLDILNSRSCITSFTMEKYNSLVKYKFGEYAYYLPVALALDMCGSIDPAIYREAYEVLTEIGIHTQIRDDYYDCFGNRDQVGTDIERNKLTWLAVNAVRLASKAQLNILKNCYGQNDPEKVEKVRGVYKDLRLDLLQKEYEKDYYDKMTQLIDNSPHDNIKPVYRSILDQFYNDDCVGNFTATHLN